MTLSPRIAHNDKLAREFWAKHGITGAVPAVSRQIASVQVNPVALSPWGYNPSIGRHQGKLVMAYRWHDEKDYSTSLAMAELDDKLHVTRNNPIEIDLHPPWDSAEDPRLFTYQNALWMSWVESNYPNRPMRCVVKYGRIVRGPPWRVESVFQVKYGKNDGSGMEKNWIFGSWRDENLYCHYTATTVLQIDGDKVVDEKQLPKVTWPWGPLKGGTGWLPMGDDLMRFFHSSLDYDLPPNRRRYYIGAVTSRGQISQKPIAIGSEDDNVPRDKRDTCLHFKPKVVFPGGAMEWQGGWLVSCGVNDCACLLLRVKPEDLHL